MCSLTLHKPHQRSRTSGGSVCLQMLPIPNGDSNVSRIHQIFSGRAAHKIHNDLSNKKRRSSLSFYGTVNYFEDVLMSSMANPTIFNDLDCQLEKKTNTQCFNVKNNNKNTQQDLKRYLISA